MRKKSEAAATTHHELKRRRKIIEREASRIALHQLERIIEFESWEEIELRRKRRKRERQASRVALDRLERSVEFDDGLEAEKEIRFMCRSSPYYNRNPLKRLGLFLKSEHSYDIDEDVVLCGDYTTTNKNFNDGGDGTLSIPLSPKQAARVSMLKSRFMDVISKSQKQLGLLDRTYDLKKQPPVVNKDSGSFKRNYSTRYCKRKPTIKAPIGGASTVA